MPTRKQIRGLILDKLSAMDRFDNFDYDYLAEQAEDLLATLEANGIGPQPRYERTSEGIIYDVVEGYDDET